MRNRLPTYPGRVHLAPVEGQANVFDLTRADQPQDPGTPLNKGTLLSDDVEALIWGAAADRTPNDAFGKVSELYQHWWSVLHGEAYSYWEEVRTPITANVYTTKYGGSFSYSQEISIGADGAITLVSPSTFTIPANAYDSELRRRYTELLSLAPIYVQGLYSDKTSIFRIPTGATVSIYNDSGDAVNASGFTVAGWSDGDGGTAEFLSAKASSGLIATKISSQLITVPAGETTYVHSPDRSAYPDSGTVDGLTYKYLGVPFDNAMKGNVEIGSYTGTGKYGSANKNTLTFNFIPKIVIIRSFVDDGYNADGSTILFVYPATNGSYFEAEYKRDIVGSWADKTLSWYSSENASDQFNRSGTKYVYFAVG